MNQSLTRRGFLRRAAALSASPVVLGSQVLADDARAPASDRITIGCIGLGAQGLSNMTAMLRRKDTQVVAVCDVHDRHYRDGEWGKGKALFGREPGRELVEATYARQKKSGTYAGCFATGNFEDLLAREDIDALVISTPDHWHVPCAVAAMESGKDVYVEKPITHLFGEGRRLIEAVKRTGAILQTGSQQRSSVSFRHAAEVVANGHLGKITRIEVGLLEGYAVPQGDPTVTAPPEGLDYDRWCGPGPKLDYMRARHHRWWRGHRGYGGGTLMDWIGHHNDIAHWAMGVERSGPIRVAAVDWEFPETDIYNTPLHYEILAEYAGGWTTSISDQHKIGTKWIGESGWLYITRGKPESSNPDWLNHSFDPGPTKLRVSDDHHGDFIEGVKSRRECIAPAEVAHRSITPGFLGYVSHAVGRPIAWNPATQEIEGDAEASEMLMAVEYRQPSAS